MNVRFLVIDQDSDVDVTVDQDCVPAIGDVVVIPTQPRQETEFTVTLVVWEPTTTPPTVDVWLTHYPYRKDPDMTDVAPRGEQDSRVINPEAIGNLDLTPVVHVTPGSGLWDVLNPCPGGGGVWCGGVNGYHRGTCPQSEL